MFREMFPKVAYTLGYFCLGGRRCRARDTTESQRFCLSKIIGLCLEGISVRIFSHSNNTGHIIQRKSNSLNITIGLSTKQNEEISAP